MSHRVKGDDLLGWDVIAADGERVGTVAAVHDSEGSGGTAGTVEVELTLPGAVGGGAPASEELRAAQRGRDVSHLRATDQRPVGGTLLGDESPAAGAYHGSMEQEVRPRDTETAAQDRMGGRRVLLPLGGVQVDRGSRRLVTLEHASYDFPTLPSPAAPRA